MSKIGSPGALRVPATASSLNPNPVLVCIAHRRPEGRKTVICNLRQHCNNTRGVHVLSVTHLASVLVVQSRRNKQEIKQNSLLREGLITSRKKRTFQDEHEHFSSHWRHVTLVQHYCTTPSIASGQECTRSVFIDILLSVVYLLLS